MSLEQRVDRVEEAISTMKNLLVSHDDRLEDYFKSLQESREDFEFKMNALIDSQIRNEIEFKEIKESIVELRKSVVELRAISESSMERLNRLDGGNK